jgi:hypothetical protein
MPLSKIQLTVLGLISTNRSPQSHLAGATGIHMSPDSLRVSHDLDLFHDTEKAVADAYAIDIQILKDNGFAAEPLISQPGFIRARIQDASDILLIDWAQDSIWRFLEPVPLENLGWVLHPVDLAVNKVHALAGRDEPRDFLDTVFLHEKVLPLGALVWAAAGKDPGLNPNMLLALLQRKGHVTTEELERLDLSTDINLPVFHDTWRQALTDARLWIDQRPPGETGCLYTDPETGRLIAPIGDQPAEILRGAPGGVLPTIHGVPARSFTESATLRSTIEAFFHQKIAE